MMPELGMDMFDADMAAAPGLPANQYEEEQLPPPDQVEMMDANLAAPDIEPMHNAQDIAAHAAVDSGA